MEKNFGLYSKSFLNGILVIAFTILGILNYTVFMIVINYRIIRNNFIGYIADLVRLYFTKFDLARNKMYKNIAII